MGVGPAIKKGNNTNLHIDMLPPETQQALEVLKEWNQLRAGPWYLAGGTALALQAGHRQSVDLDFFTSKPDFDTALLERQLLQLGQWSTTFQEEGTLYGTCHGAKVSFIALPSFQPAPERRQYGSISILLPPDIAAMKVMAISQRGKRRDFIDLYWYCTQSEYREALEDVVQRALEQHSVQRDHTIHLLKSLVYFVDAENDPMPILSFPAQWPAVCEYFEHAVSAIMKEYKNNTAVLE